MQSPQPPPGLTYTVPSQHDRLLAALAHISILIPHAGIVAPLIIWLVNRDTSPFPAYQAKQAFFFHLAVIVLTWVFFVSAFVLAVMTLGLGLLVILPLAAALSLVPMIYGIVGAIKAYEGRDFRYWIIGEVVQPD